MTELTQTQIDKLMATHDNVLVMGEKVDDLHKRHESCPIYNNKMLRTSTVLKAIPYIVIAIVSVMFAVGSHFGWIPSAVLK